MKTLLFLLLPVASLQADLTLTPAPENRGENTTAFAIFDSLSGLSFSNATGNSNADSSHNLSNAVLSQSAAVGFPGGVKLNTPIDFRVYTFTSATDWTITATPQISYNTATLRIHEYGGAQPGSTGQALPGSGLTDYTYTLNSTSPTSLTAEVFIFDEGTSRERFEYVTTAVWTLSEPASNLDLKVLGNNDAHDSIDSFILDLETTTPTPSATPPNLQITHSGAQVTLSWPEGTTAILESTTDLTDPESWQPVETEPASNNDQNNVTLPHSATSTYFRLKS